MNRTMLVIGVGIMLCAVSLFWLQGRFDKSDHAKALRLVQNLERSKDDHTTFGPWLQRRFHGQAGVWTTNITGGCRGVVKVTWTIPGNPPYVYSWDVEIPSQTVHPSLGSPEGKRLLEDFVAGREDNQLNLPPLEPAHP